MGSGKATELYDLRANVIYPNGMHVNVWGILHGDPSLRRARRFEAVQDPGEQLTSAGHALPNRPGPPDHAQILHRSAVALQDVIDNEPATRSQHSRGSAHSGVRPMPVHVQGEGSSP